MSLHAWVQRLFAIVIGYFLRLCHHKDVIAEYATAIEKPLRGLLLAREGQLRKNNIGLGRLR